MKWKCDPFSRVKSPAQRKTCRVSVFKLEVISSSCKHGLIRSVKSSNFEPEISESSHERKVKLRNVFRAG